AKFDKSADDLRDPRITPLKAVDINELTVRTQSDAYKLVKSAAGWNFEEAQPDITRPDFNADDAQTAALLDAIVKAQATGYASDGELAAPPVGTVTLSAIGRPEPDVLRIHAADSNTYPVYRNQETVGYRVPTDALAAVFKPALALRDREVIDLP